MIGNSIISFADVLPNNPVTAVVSHTAMRVAAVPLGAETTVQLPMHYWLIPGHCPPTFRIA